MKNKSETAQRKKWNANKLDNLAKLREYTKLAMAHIGTVNQEGANSLLRKYYAEVLKAGNTFKSFNSWRSEGKKVKKGEKGYLFWTKPLTFLKKEDLEKEGKEEGKPANFFAYCFLFTEKQVE